MRLIRLLWIEKRISACLGVILLLLLVSLTLFLRRPDTLLNPQLWAEDGIIFLAQQREYGSAAVLMPYAGYYHLVPRLIALTADQFSLYYTPAIYNGAAFLIFLLVSLFVFFISNGSNSYRFCFAIAPVLVPHTGEVLVNVTNIQWILGITLPFLYAQRPLAEWRRTALAVLIILAVGLTGPFVVLSCPLLLCRALWQRKLNIYEVCFYAATVLVIVIQGMSLLKEPAVAESATPVWSDWVKAIFERFGAYLYFGKYLPGQLPVTTSVVSAVMIFATLLGAALVSRGNRYMALLIFSYGIMIFCAAMKKFAHAPLALHPVLTGPRYYYLPYLSFFFLYLILAREPAPWLQWLGRIGVVLLVISGATLFRVPQLPDFNWRKNIDRLAVEGHATVPFPPGWSIELHSRDAGR
jgi:hypothetical protein